MSVYTASNLDNRQSYQLRAVLESISDRGLVDGILEMFLKAAELARAGEIDACVLSARRLTCLYQALRDRGLPEIDCRVVSDRALDLTDDSPDRTWWVGKSVLVLDDSVVLGSSLLHLHAKLSALVDPEKTGSAARLLRVEAVCIDGEEVNRKFIEHVGLTPWAGERTSEQVKAFSKQLGQVLFRNQMPYFSDFPVTLPLDLSGGNLERLLTLEHWATINVTSQQLAAPDQFAYTLVPRADALERVLGRLPSAVTPLVDIAKIRLFGRIGDPFSTVVVVPVAVLAPTPLAALDLCVQELKSSLRDVAPMRGFDMRSRTPASRQRLLQMYVTIVTLATFWEDAEGAGALDQALGEAVVRWDMADLHLGPDTAKVTRSAFAPIVAWLAGHHDRVTAAGYPGAAAPSVDMTQPLRGALDRLPSLMTGGRPLHHGTPRGATSFISDRFVQAIASVFDTLDQCEERERSQRRDQEPDEYLDEYSDKSDRWERCSVTLEDLAAAAGLDGSDGVLDVSIAIDVLNDIGIAVPHTYLRAGVLSRRYRMGENAHVAAELRGEVSRLVAEKSDSDLVGAVRALVLDDRDHRLVPRIEAAVSRVGAPYPPEGARSWDLQTWDTITDALRDQVAAAARESAL